MVKDDGISIVGTTWVAGLNATGGNSFKHEGVFFNEIGMEGTKEEVIDLSGAKVGDKFNCENGHRPELVFISGEGNYCLSLNGELFLYKVDGSLIQHVSENGEHLVSKHDPRWWLKKLPDADLFGDDVEWIECKSNGDWVTSNIKIYHCMRGIKMPTLTGDEWKQSKISIDDLREWQDEYINV